MKAKQKPMMTGKRTSKMPTIAPQTSPMCIRNRQKVIVKHLYKP